MLSFQDRIEKITFYAKYALFQVHHSELAEQSLKVVVLDNSRSRGRKIIGQLIYSLKNSRLESGRQVTRNVISLLYMCYRECPQIDECRLVDRSKNVHR